ncbi:ATP-grasp domain-containing protein [Methylobacterium organophilum]|uniref:ATP-grasp domain-containing protein n=1 Tax=Methylobacterium organophilum TaxID=410 RepID=UPI001F12A879|nr:ATP-grasp domain-containing protein [Methylobacterium organophilum]UMY16918.1 ATP-grasp domain-containing protein [Methylobacterium organophilum]
MGREASPAGEAILIAAQSGRALAEAARRAGLRPLVLDLFGDADTRALAEAYRPLPGRFGTGRLGGAALLAGLEALAEGAGRLRGVVLGSGFEGAPDLMRAIAARFPLIGAEPETVAALKDPFALAALCARLGIPHPPVTREPVPDRARWLLKRVGGSGGSHIRAATAGAAPPGGYFQARVSGRAFALNVLADGRGITPLALTEQWSAPSPLRPFRYAGALARGRGEPGPVPPALVERVSEAVARLVAATGLRGLASADLLIDGPDWWLMEINPRPGATLDVLDRQPTPLLAAHIEAAFGRLPPPEPAPEDAAGAEICYAASRYAPVPSLDWPGFVRDRPVAGSVVARDAPLCTLLASGPDAGTVRERLREHAEATRALLEETETTR